MRLPRKRVIFGTLAGVLLLVLLIPAWLYYRPFLPGHSKRTDAIAILRHEDPKQALQAANHFSWLSNSLKAGPLYKQAATLFGQEGDARDALYARVGYIRAQAESTSFVDISNFLAAQLQSPLVRQHPRLRLWCLISKGHTDIEIDIAGARQDWEEARKLALQLGEKAWANRATGELGLIAFMGGKPLRAARMVGKALITAMATGDVGAEIRYFELLGDGFREIGGWPVRAAVRRALPRGK